MHLVSFSTAFFAEFRFIECITPCIFRLIMHSTHFNSCFSFQSFSLFNSSYSFNQRISFNSFKAFDSIDSFNCFNSSIPLSTVLHSFDSFDYSLYAHIAPHCPAVQKERATTAAIHSARVRRYLSDSIYLWPCGEKSESDDEELTVSDGLIGWLTLLVCIDR